MKDICHTLQEKAYEVAEANKLLQETVTVTAKVLSTEEAIGNPEEDDLPLQKGRDRLMEAEFLYKPIGVIRSEHHVAAKTPIQPAYAKGCKGRVEIFPEFAKGLQDLDGFSHVYLIYHLHQAGSVKLTVKPFLQDVERGVFATRAPCRPNAIGLSVVDLVGCEGNVLYLEGVDILDGTPLLDIKPYTARFDRIETTRNGWQDEVDEETAQRRGRRGYEG